MTLLTFRVDSKSTWSRSREGIASNKVGRFCARAEICFKFNSLRQQPERLISDTIAFTGKRPSGVCVHSSRAGMLIIFKNFAVLFERSSDRIRGWTVKGVDIDWGIIRTSYKLESVEMFHSRCSSQDLDALVGAQIGQGCMCDIVPSNIDRGRRKIVEC
jgi:hypothetical protein